MPSPSKKSPAKKSPAKKSPAKKSPASDRKKAADRYSKLLKQLAVGTSAAGLGLAGAYAARRYGPQGMAAARNYGSRGMTAAGRYMPGMKIPGMGAAKPPVNTTVYANGKKAVLIPVGAKTALAMGVPLAALGATAATKTGREQIKKGYLRTINGLSAAGKAAVGGIREGYKYGKGKTSTLSPQNQLMQHLGELRRSGNLPGSTQN